MDWERDMIHGACHCGTVKFTVKLAGGLAAARRCDCSFCRMRGAVVLSSELADLTVTEGAEALALYQFNSGVAEHHFCKVCGIYTHHRRRGNPNQYGINAACLEGLSPFDFAEVAVVDGIVHPKDRADGRSLVVGMLRYQAVPPRDD